MYVAIMFTCLNLSFYCTILDRIIVQWCIKTKGKKRGVLIESKQYKLYKEVQNWYQINRITVEELLQRVDQMVSEKAVNEARGLTEE